MRVYKNIEELKYQCTKATRPLTATENQIADAFWEEGMKTQANSSELYTIDQIIDIINDCKLEVPIDKLFNDNGNHITKKEYGHILVKIMCDEIKMNYPKTTVKTECT